MTGNQIQELNLEEFIFISFALNLLKYLLMVLRCLCQLGWGALMRNVSLKEYYCFPWLRVSRSNISNLINMILTFTSVDVTLMRLWLNAIRMNDSNNNFDVVLFNNYAENGRYYLLLTSMKP